MNDELGMMCDSAVGVLAAPSPMVQKSPPIRKKTQLALVCALIVSVAALLIALAWPMLRGEVYLTDDLGEFHLPLRTFYAQQLTRGEPFDWCPDLYCGFYLTGEGQVGAYHPLHWLLYRTLPLSLAFDLECLLSYPLMLVGLYVLLKRWRLGCEAALFGAMAFTFGGFNLLHFVHPNAIAVIAHLPWLLLGIDVAMKSRIPRYRLRAWATVGLLTGSQLLLGYPQYVLYSAFVELGYVVLMGVTATAPVRKVFQGLASWLAALMLGVLIAGVQLLPTIDLLQHSVRQHSSEQLATSGSLHPFNLMQLVAPYLFIHRVVGENTHELGLYVGAVPLALALWHLIASRENRRRFRGLTCAAIAAVGFGLLWSFGEFGPFAWLEQHLPLVNKFRLPCRAIIIFQLGIAILAALSFADIVVWQTSNRSIADSLHRTHRLWLLPLVATMIAIMAATVWPQFIADWPLVAIGPVFILIATCLIKLATNRVRWALPAIVFFAAGDLTLYGMSESIFHRTAPLADFVKQTDAPPGEPNCRVAIDLACGLESAPGQNGPRVGDRILLKGCFRTVSEKGTVPFCSADSAKSGQSPTVLKQPFSRWQRVDGYAGLEPNRRLDYRQLPALQLAGVGWISQRAANQLPESSEHTYHTTGSWISIPHPSPRARLVTAAISTDEPAVDLANLSENQALVDTPLHLAAGQPGVATVVVDQPGRVVVDTNCSTEQLLIVNESYYPGWKASIDGHEAKPLRVNGDFLGVVVPAGHHEIGLEFQPESLRIGRLASCFGLGLLVVTFLLGTRLPRPAKS